MKKIQFRQGSELLYPVVEGGNTYKNGIKTNSVQVVYVNANSESGGDGTSSSPYNTLSAAVSQIDDNVETDIYVSGELRFIETLNVGSGKKINIIGDGKSSLLGTKLFTMQDRHCASEIQLYVGDVCPQWIFVDGKVRYPASTNRDDLYITGCTGVFDSVNDTMATKINIPASDAVKLSQMDCSDMWVTVLWMWMSYKCRIDHIDTTNNQIVCVQGNGSTLHAMTGNLRIILENANIASCSMFNNQDLWQKGTYYVSNGYLHYKYMDDEDIYGNVEIPSVETLIHSDGDLSLYNLNIGKTNHVFDNTCGEGEHGGYSGRQACARFNAAIELNGQSNVMFCNFEYTTNHAVRLYNSAHDCAISNNNFRELGCSSIVVGWVPLAFKTNIPAICPDKVLIENNSIVTIGRIYAGACGLSVFYGSNYKIRYNVIRNTYYTGITTGYTWTTVSNPNANGLIEYNVVDLIGTGVQALYDGGAFYNLGDANGLEIKHNIISNVYGKHPSNDSQNSSLALDSFFFDNGSANVTVTYNLVYHVKSFYRIGLDTTNKLYFTNNIFYDDFTEFTQKTYGSVTHNVFLFNHNPTSSTAFNNNIWYKLSGQQPSLTWDSNGVSGDPFYNAENKDYRIESTQIAESGSFTSFIPKVVGRWVDSKLTAADKEKVIYYLNNYWSGNLPK